LIVTDHMRWVLLYSTCCLDPVSVPVWVYDWMWHTISWGWLALLASYASTALQTNWTFSHPRWCPSCSSKEIWYDPSHNYLFIVSSYVNKKRPPLGAVFYWEYWYDYYSPVSALALPPYVLAEFCTPPPSDGSATIARLLNAVGPWRLQ